MVALDPRTGAILAMVSHPDYDPGVWTGGVTAAEYAALTDPAAGSPLVSRIAGATFPPASTFKVVSALALLRSGLRPDAPVQCPATTTVDGRPHDAPTLHEYPCD